MSGMNYHYRYSGACVSPQIYLIQKGHNGRKIMPVPVVVQSLRELVSEVEEGSGGVGPGGKLGWRSNLGSMASWRGYYKFLARQVRRHLQDNGLLACSRQQKPRSQRTCIATCISTLLSPCPSLGAQLPFFWSSSSFPFPHSRQ